MRTLRRSLAALLVLGLSACATAAGDPQDPFDGAAGEDQIRIEVENFNFADATVWALVQGGRRIRLGTVTGKSDSVFTLPWRFSVPLRMEIDQVAGERCVTEEIPVDPGDILLLRIEPVFTDTRGCR